MLNFCFFWGLITVDAGEFLPEDTVLCDVDDSADEMLDKFSVLVVGITW